MPNYDITSSTQKTLTELFAQWDSSPVTLYSKLGFIECAFLIRNPYDKPGRLYSMEYSIDGGTTKHSATVLHTRGVGTYPFNLNAKNQKISVWWFVAYDLRLMQNYENVKLYVKFCEDLTDDTTEELEHTMDIDLRPTGILSQVHPQVNDRYFNLKFVSKATITKGSLHFIVEVDKVETFDSQDKITLSTRETPSDWLTDGSTFPDEGIDTDQVHTIAYNGSELSSLTQDTYYYRVSTVFNNFYPLITAPDDGHSFSGATLDVTGHVEVVDDVRETYTISCAAGRFNFSWNNPSARVWEFPAGTVIYGTSTPISWSIDEQPDVEIPAGGGDVILKTYGFEGRFELNDGSTDAGFVGDLEDLPRNLNFSLNLHNCSQVTGDLSDLPQVTNILNLYKCSQITGNLSDMPPVEKTLLLYNCYNITGDIKYISHINYYLDLNGCGSITGSFADLPAISYYLRAKNLYQVSGAFTAVHDDVVPSYTYFDNTGMSADDMDNTLIAYAACTKDNGYFQATGKTRTAASDAAVATLVARGWTVTGITKV